MDRIDRAGVPGHEEVLEEVEVFINAMTRSFPEQPNHLYKQQLDQLLTNVERLVRNGNISQILRDRVKNKATHLRERYHRLLLVNIGEDGVENQQTVIKYKHKKHNNKPGNSYYDIDKSHLKF